MEYIEIQSIDRKDVEEYFLYFMNYPAKGNSYPSRIGSCNQSDMFYNN